ncbi:MAG TPA: ATP phosphoribosyltransferase regulatory subunit, partial [Anaerovoracaceae bacterium]|nr:ATP phosphoribosyltransferase regulatory subunit [Anaerovoracaceae bacterium]
MEYKMANLKPDEIATLKIRGIYEQAGYKKYKMSRFEEYSLYAENKDFLGGEKMITFTDLDGRLLALKPDVTLSIINNSRATRKNPEKLYYIE